MLSERAIDAWINDIGGGDAALGAMMERDLTANGAETRMVHPVFPGDTNHYHTLFGGTAMSWMDEAAFICATRWCRKPVVTVHSGAMSFHRPVPEGTIVELIARVTATGRTSMTVAVELWIEPMDRPERTLASQAEFVLVAVDAEHRPVAVPPLAPTDATREETEQ